VTFSLWTRRPRPDRKDGAKCCVVVSILRDDGRSVPCGRLVFYRWGEYREFMRVAMYGGSVIREKYGRNVRVGVIRRVPWK